MNTEIFTEYACSLGTVIGHQAAPPAYLIRTAGGEVTGIPANGVPSAEAVESDIANPPAPPADPAAVWAGILAGVITDADTGIALKASDAVRGTLTAMLVMLREAESAGAITATTEQTIWDANNEPHVLTVAALRGLLLRYSFAWQALHAQYAP